MTSYSASPALPAVVATPLPEPAQTAAVTDSRTVRLDPDRPPDPAILPAPLKGLGIPPLHMRQVGDFDRIDDPPPPMGIDLPARLADLDPPPPPRVDLRR